MDCLNGDQDGVLHAFDLDADAGGHAGQHTVRFFQFHHGGISARGCAGAVDLRQGTGEGILADRSHGDGDFLTQFQRQDIRLVHADGDGHLLVTGDGGDGGSRAFFIVIHAVDTAESLGQHGTIPLDGQQFQKHLFLFAAAAQEGIVVGTVSSIFQSEELGFCGDLLIQAGLDGIHSTGVGSDPQGAVNVKGTFPDLSTFAVQNGDSIFIGGAVVGNQNGGLAAHGRFHGAGNGIAFGQLHGDGITGGQGIGFHIHSHIAIQRQQCQGTVLVHDIHHIVVGLCKDGLDTTGNTGINHVTGFVILCITELFIQFLNFRLQICHGTHNGSHIHGGQNVAFRHGVVGLHQHFGDLHAVGNGDGSQIHIRQTAGTGYHRTDGAGGHVIRQHFPGRRCELLPHLPLKCPHADDGSDSQHQNDRNHRDDDFPSLSFLVFAQCFKEGIVFLHIVVLFCHGCSFRFAKRDIEHHTMYHNTDCIWYSFSLSEIPMENM